LGKLVGKGRGQQMSDEMRNREGAVPSAGNHALDLRPKNWLTPVILVTLREKSSHGYELMQRIARFGFEAINPGTLYRRLKQMENEGLCESEWKTSKECGRPRRVYAVTDAGETYLRFWAEGCQKYQKVLDAFHLAHITACVDRRPLGTAPS
jgi:PadR family transcriptional regulator, regulatory protein PadR